MPHVDLASIVAVVAAIALIYIIGRVLVMPLKVISKLVINGVVGAILLFLLNAVGGMIHINIAINPITALIAGFLGIPGIILLIFLQFIL